MKASGQRREHTEPEMFISDQPNDPFAQLTEETERLAQHVEELRLRIAASARRRNSSGTQRVPSDAGVGEAPAVEPTEAEASARVTPPCERESCLANVSRWLPPLAPTTAAAAGSPAGIEESGRYSLINSRRMHHFETLRPAPHRRFKVPA